MTTSRGLAFRDGTRAAIVVVSAVAASLSSMRAEAHTIGLSTGEYRPDRGGLAVKLALARGDAAQLSPGLDANRDRHVTALEVEAAKRDLEARVLGRIDVRSLGVPCAPTLVSASLSDQDGLSIDGRFDCPKTGGPFDVSVRFLDDLAEGHRHVARAVGETISDAVLARGTASFTVTPRGSASEPETAATETDPRGRSPAASSPPSAWSFFAMGFEHILRGYDHLVFLLGLVVLRARLRDLVAAVSSFTLGHSVSLAAATLGVVVPNPRVIEAVIALSIAYVGVENLLVKSAAKRWRIAFLFGLVHGFGFAGALRAVELPKGDVPVALGSFNVGVEIAQLAAIGVVLPMLGRARKLEGFEPRGERIISGLVAAAGGVWFFARVVGGG